MKYNGLDRSKVQRMLVWDNNGKDAIECYVLFINSDGSCVTIDDEERFFEGDDFPTEYWKHCKPIPEKKTRFKTRMEVLQFLSDKQDKVFVRIVEDYIWQLPAFFKYDEPIKEYEWCYKTYLETVFKFEIEE